MSDDGDESLLMRDEAMITHIVEKGELYFNIRTLEGRFLDQRIYPLWSLSRKNFKVNEVLTLCDLN